MSKYPKLNHYVSDLDRFLMAFDQSHPQTSASQKAEKDKHNRLYYLRDHELPAPLKTTTTLWEEF